MRLVSKTALCAAGYMLVSTANAQDVQNFDPAAGTWNYLSVESAKTADKGSFVPSLYLNYARNPLTQRDRDGEIIEEIVSHMTTLDLLAVYGITDWLDVSLALPMSSTSGGPGLAAVNHSDGFALNDIRLTPKATVFRTDTVKLALALPVTAPTGDGDTLTGDETWKVQAKAIGEISLGDTSAAINVGYLVRQENPKVNTLEVGNELTYAAAVSHALRKDFKALAEVYGATPAESVDGENNTHPLEGLLGARYSTPWCGVFTGGAGIGIIGDYGTPQYRALAGFAWECPPAPSDRDKDGLVDAKDSCPDDPEDKDGFEDADGCPDPDNDADTVLDVDDKCPMEAEDRDTFSDADGCPDPDNDDDGILDTADKCPMETEDKDGFEDEDGCPDPDNDKDNIADANDRCPLKPETVNGVDDEDGCPDSAKVTVKAGKIEVLERIYFAFGSDELDPRSHPILDQVATTLNAHPEIKKIRVEGHTDSKGRARINKPLSQRRADAVRAYLISQEVAADRLEAKGYGSTRPLKKPGTKGAADKNRRVEFIILDGNASVRDTQQ